MTKSKIFQGKCEVNTSTQDITGRFVDIGGLKYYQIQNYHEMPDFFMSIASDSDHWIFISSNGSLSAGRKDRNNALFPYYTVDEVHDYKDITGSITCLSIQKEDGEYIWEPFSNHSPKFYHITRNIYKSYLGNSIIFEEVNHDLGITFKYGWFNSEKYGFVKHSYIINDRSEKTTVKVLDGIQNILPYGVDYAFQNEYSNLLDAYKKNELVEDSTIGLFMLSSIPVDRAEPSEALKTTSVWSSGLDNDLKILLSRKQVCDFKAGKKMVTEKDIKASRGAYLINSTVVIKPGRQIDWMIVAEINQGPTDIIDLKSSLSESSKLKKAVLKDIAHGTSNLKKMVAFADGMQMTNNDLSYARHYTNTMFNIMRGGVFVNNYSIDINDFKNYVWSINRLVLKEFSHWLDDLENGLTSTSLIEKANKTENSDLIRIVYEYLPLTFSRRHGDPSRPWNIFSIETKKENGKINYNYQGNWRDIFQNWEALCLSFPEFIEGIISKFLNASTIDGYNPYRIMRDGIDWESPEPNDPWSYIGYWGDHQIIYLQKLLELSEDYHPGRMDSLLESDLFTYSNVPYRIKSYDKLIKNPQDTVEFDSELDKHIKSEVEYLGADARLLKTKLGDSIYKVNLTEKILATSLSKLSNFIPEAGIWLNTQRPEWNDANNALVGNGASMVTLYYLRRFLKFWQDKFTRVSINDASISEELATLFSTLNNIFSDNLEILDDPISDEERKTFTDSLGQAHWKYRNEIYNYGFSGEKVKVKIIDIKTFFNICIQYIDHSIEHNKREDGLYHSYNLVSFCNDKISIRNLYEMLEGQVAILSSGFLSSNDSLELLDALKSSKMFRPDQYSYMLYPDRQLPRFLEKNNIPKEMVNKSELLKKLVADNEKSIIDVDIEGNYHFNGEFRNVDLLEKSLDNLRHGFYSHMIEEEKDYILSVYEKIFDHQSFTGRSGTFYGYEGLGSIYWHMVSKLLLAIQENYFRALNDGLGNDVTGRFKAHYYETKAGIGLYKSPDLYGAFPMDAYSHTPSNAGVKQPGLTGQVKEDVISRFGELGVRILNGSIYFKPSLLNPDEILDYNKTFEYFSVKGKLGRFELKAHQLGFTFCQVPIVYTFSDKDAVNVIFKNGSMEKMAGNMISKNNSDHIFKRTGKIELIEVTIKVK
ncbi:MAG: hypothetical protein CMF58_00555 [Lentimicrobiaceae bacterium]|jgi:hypothetical protein|nr:hypothetical protein [Lentimicrobiaceae bacterium]MDG2081341.1 hypothetical protein [Bacteroidales bacterium]|tara:strand:+ start:979 stop:4443 length:3465 start_codon:yes stop_codon:yes gene_type:complete